jgi:hypothetical protein
LICAVYSGEIELVKALMAMGVTTDMAIEHAEICNETKIAKLLKAHNKKSRKLARLVQRVSGKLTNSGGN